MTTTITKEQEVRIFKLRDEYLEIGRSTGRCNRSAVEDVMLQLYRQIDGNADKNVKFHWYSSPREACIEGSKILDLKPIDVFNARHSIHWQSWFSHCEILRREGIITLEPDVQEKLSLWDTLFRNAHWVFVFEGVILCSERPTVLKIDAEGRLHCENGPALVYADDSKVYSWHGTTIPGEWIENKSTLTAQIALTHENVEERRCAAEILGWDAILKELQPTVIDKDANPEIGELLRCDLPGSPNEQFLKVKCGTGRDFVLPVPPNMETARQANAWTYSLDEKDYNLEIRT